MVRLRFHPVPALLAAVLLVSLIFALSPAEAEVPDADASHDGEFEPGMIPTSAVAPSDNCAEISRIEEQFERGITAQDLQRIQGPEQRPPLGVSGKFRLAVANVTDPFNIVITALDSEIGNATDGPSPLHRGALGFGERFGTAMAGTATGEFFSTFVYASIFHQDPHYYRSPDASVGTRLRRALQYVVITRSDSGRTMFNFDEVLGTTTSSLIEGTFHPEWEKGPGAASGRIFISIGSDAAWNLMTEFLPDIAKHVNPRVMLLRRLADKAASQN
jgi:hypothetical protein